jgi:undecaprenyl-diphosphatase
VWTAALWGLVQGLTEFLPISSSGHLVLVPALFELEGPSLATSAVLHLGTLAAVVWYFRSDLARLTNFRTDAAAARLLKLLIIGTIPAAALGITLESWFDDLNDRPRAVAVALVGTGLVLAASEAFRRRVRDRDVESATTGDAVIIGAAQAAALVPGISRSGMTIVAGLARSFEPTEAARFAFLLAVPVIFGSGLVQAVRLANEGGLTAGVWLGVVVAAGSGYLAIAALLRLIRRTGLMAFSAYCLILGTWSVIVL